jgi:AraC family transcriptional activator of mtrCDE
VVRSVLTDGTSRSIVTEFRNAVRTKSTPGVAYDTELVCGVLRGEAASEQALMAALPNFVVLAERLHMLAICISDELDSNETGSTIIATNLATALFVMMLREHLKEAPPASGPLALLTHRSTSHAVLAMLREPARDSTLDLLAKASAASRATLVRSFRKLAGLAPLAFLTELRLGFARQRLMTTNDPICVIAADVGYESEGALSRALLRRYGVRPSKLLFDRSGSTPHSGRAGALKRKGR